MALFLLASKWDRLAEVLDDVSKLSDMADLLRQGDVGTWTVLGVVVHSPSWYLLYARGIT